MPYPTTLFQQSPKVRLGRRRRRTCDRYPHAWFYPPDWVCHHQSDRSNPGKEAWRFRIFRGLGCLKSAGLQPIAGVTEMAKPRYLTKSRFNLAVECPRKLFYTGKKDIYQDAMAEDKFLEMLAEGGYQVGALAKLRYPDGIEIRETEHAAAESATQALMERDHVVLFEPAIRVGNFFIRIDVLVKDGNN